MQAIAFSAIILSIIIFLLWIYFTEKMKQDYSDDKDDKEYIKVKKMYKNGYSEKEIAKDRNIKVATVKRYLRKK